MDSEQYKEAFRRGPAPSLILARGGAGFTVEEVNDAWVALTLGKGRVILGRTVRELQPERPDIEDHIERCASGGETLSYETTVTLSPTGERKDVILTFVRLLGDSVMLHVRDVTEARVASRALMDSEARYRNVIAAMTEGVVVQDRSAAILACNSAAEEMLGLTADQMMGRTSLDPRWRSIHPDGSPFPGETHPVPVTLRTGQPLRRVQMGVHKPDGTLTWLSINSQPMFREGEPSPYAAVCTFSDVTEQKQTLDALRASEERLRLSLRASRTATWEWRPDDDRASGSVGLAEILGVPPADVESLGAFLQHAHPADKPRLMDAIVGVLQGEAGSIMEVDHRVILPDGRTRWLHSNGIVVGQGTAMRILGTSTDVTARKLLEEELLQAQKLESLGRLAGGIAHDFNNLLTIIIASTEFAHRQASEGVRGDLATIRSAAERAGQLTRQLLAFARKQVVEPTTLDLGALIQRLMPLLRRTVGEDVTFEVDLHPTPVWTRADAGQIEQLVVNLVVNARDAMPGGGRIVVKTGLTTLDAPAQPGTDDPEPGAYVTLTVSDGGVGMDPSTLARVFEPFFTTKESGTGLGLASCYGIARQAGGTIRVESELGSGATFTVYLPSVGESTRQAEAAQSRRRQGRSRARVLLVEDEEILRKTVARALATRGYDVLVAHDGEEGLLVARAHAGAIDIAVVDVVMPKMGGRKLAEKLHELSPNMPILFVSGYSGEVAAATDDVLMKPYTLESLSVRIEELLAKQADPA